MTRAAIPPGPDLTGHSSPHDLVRWLISRADRPLLLLAASLLLLVVPCAAMALIDGRTIDGANVWLKPIKFQISVAIFLATLALMLPLAGSTFRNGPIGRATVWLAITTSIFEIAYITLQAARAERSHFNSESALGATMYALMGIAAVLLALTPAIVAAASTRAQQPTDRHRVVRFGAVLGTVLGLAGTTVIGIMLGGRSSHFIGGDGTDATGPPFVGWSTTGGDLRIAHYVGMHAMQALLFAGVLLAPASRRVAYAAMLAVALSWIGATVWLARVALAGRTPWHALGIG